MLRIGGLLIACALLVWLGVRLFTRRGGGRIQAPSCRQCLYNITGLPTGVCPECGSSLEAGGVLHPNRLVPLSRLTRLVVWTAIIAGVAVFAVPLIDSRLPKPRVFNFQLNLGPPPSGAYARLAISGSQHARGSAMADIRHARITVTHDHGTQSLLTVDLVRNTARSDPSGESRRWSLHDEASATAALREWFDLVGLKGDRDAMNREAEALAQLLLYGEHLSNDRRALFHWGKAIAGFEFREVVGNFTVTRATTAAPDPWRQAMLVGPWAGLWMAVALPLVFLSSGPRSRRSAVAVVQT